MAAKLLTVVVDCTDPLRQATFWSQVLGYDVSERNPDEFLASDPNGVAMPVYFMRVPEPKVGKNRLHLDLVAASMDEEVERLVALGARLVEHRQDPDTYDHPDIWSVLEDPESNVFCVSVGTPAGWPDSGTTSVSAAR